jgi:hypothetical protein
MAIKVGAKGSGKVEIGVIGKKLADIEKALNSHSPNIWSTLTKYIGTALQELQTIISTIDQDVAAFVLDLLKETTENMVASAGESDSVLEGAIAGLLDGSSLVGPGLGAIAVYFFGKVAVALQDLIESPMENMHDIKPGDEEAASQAGYKNAFIAGGMAHTIAALAEIIHPLKALGFPQLAATLADLADFKTISQARLRPLIQTHIQQPALYAANAKARSNLPQIQELNTMAARGVIHEDVRAKYGPYSGFAAEFDAAMRDMAYRPISPFMVLRAMQSGAIPEDEGKAIMSFAGQRPDDIAAMQAAYKVIAVEPYITKALSTLVGAYAQGDVPDSDFSSALADFHLPDGAEHYIRLEAEYTKLRQLTEIYRKSVDEAYTYGLVTDAEYVSRLEAIGIAAPDAEAHYSFASIKKLGKAANAAERAAERAAHALSNAGIRQANTQYLMGQSSVEQLAVQLAAAGMQPDLVPITVAIMQARAAGRLLQVYNLRLPREQAHLLKAKVAVVQEQMTKGITDASFAAGTLKSFGLDDRWTEALVAKWEAQKYKKVMLP